jgi:hypothetical protein
MEIHGIITKARMVKREQFDNCGITIVFKTELGELSRTYNIPRHNNNKCFLLKILQALGIKAPLNLIDKPMLFCLALEKTLKNIECQLSISTTGKSSYPYNIDSIRPILTIETKYPTQKNQEKLSIEEYL